MKKGGSAGFGRAYSSRGGSRQSSLDAQMKVCNPGGDCYWKGGTTQVTAVTDLTAA